MTCRDCKFLDVRPDADGKRRVRKNNAYRCLAPIPDICALLPHSVPEHQRRNFSTSWIAPEMGKDCPSAQPVKQGEKAA